MGIIGGVLDDNIDFGKLKSAGLSDAQINNILQSSRETINVRTEEKDPYVEIHGLPSGSRYYKNPMGIPVRLKGMPLKVSDSITLEAMENSGDETLLDDIFRARIKGVEPGQILIGDETYIKAWLREQTFIRTPLIRSFECEKCLHFNESRIITSNDFIVYYLPDTITDPMPCKLPISGQEVKIRFMRRNDRVRIENHVRENDFMRKLNVVDTKIYEIASVMYAMSITDATEFIKSLDPTDFAVLNTFFLKMNFGFTEKAFIKCEKEECGYSSIVPIPFQPGYFLPKIGPDLSNQD